MAGFNFNLLLTYFVVYYFVSLLDLTTQNLGNYLIKLVFIILVYDEVFWENVYVTNLFYLFCCGSEGNFYCTR